MTGSAPTDRKGLVCIECGHGLAAHLKGHMHFQHLPGAPENCPGRSPETRLHREMKHKLAEILKLRTTTGIIPTCGMHRSGINGMVRPFPQQWDEVRVERHTGTLRPDISLWADGACVLAIEILVTNPVSDTKAATFREQGLSWIEVQAKALSDHLKETCNIEPTGPDVGPMEAVPALHVRLGEDCWECTLCAATRSLPRRRKKAEVAPTAFEAREIGKFTVDWQRELRCQTLSGDVATLDEYIGRIEGDTPETSLVGMYVTSALLPVAERSMLAFEKYRSDVRADFDSASKEVVKILQRCGASVVSPRPWQAASDLGREWTRPIPRRSR